MKVKVPPLFQGTFSSQRGALDDVTNEVATLRGDLQRLEADFNRLMASVNAKMTSLPWFNPQLKVSDPFML